MEEYIHILAFFLGFIWIVVASNQISKYILKLKLPLITGFLISGIIAGPFVLNLITFDAIKELDFANDIALAFIAFAAGTELYLKEIRTNIKSIVWNTFGQLIVTFFMGAMVVFLIANYIPYMKNMHYIDKVAISILTATIFVARSPSSAIAVMNEMKAKGPFTQIALSVTVIKDFLVIILFAISISIAYTLIKHEPLDLMHIAYILTGLLSTFLLGYIYSFLLKGALHLKMKTFLKTSLIIGIGFSVYVLSNFLSLLAKRDAFPEIHIEPLLICIIASFRITNYSKYRIEFQKIIDETGPATYAAFFTLTGAMMALDVLADLWLIALILFTVRLSSVVIGAITGSFLAKDPQRFKKISWMPYITQAGVSLALVYEIASEFPEWGSQFATVIIAVIVLNQLIGPPLFKLSIKIAKESHLPVKTKTRHSHQALIFGFENQSVALSSELNKHGWNVDIATRRSQEITTKIPGVNIVFISDLFKDTMDKLQLKKYETIILFLSDSENLRVVKFVNEYIGVQTIIVRLNNRRHLNDYRDQNVIIVDPAIALVNLLDHFVRSPLATQLLLGMEEDKDSVDIVVKDKKLHGMALRDLRLPVDVLILSVKRKGQTIISHGYTRLRLGDVITLVGSVDSLLKIELDFEF